MTPTDAAVLKVLIQGRLRKTCTINKPRKGPALLRAAGLPSRGEAKDGWKLRAIVNRLRNRYGWPIGSTCKGDHGIDGYWLAETPAELEGTIQNLRGRIASVAQTIASLQTFNHEGRFE